MINNKRIIVLGSSGFIGSHLVSWFRSQDYHVAGVDMANNAALALGLKEPDIFYRFILPDKRFEDVIKEFRPEAIINASGPSSVANSLLNPAADFYGSVNLGFSVLESIRKVLPDCRYLLLSSAAVYGNPAYLPVSEDTKLNPISPYGYHKMMCEELIREYFDIYGVRTSTVRIFSAYGPGLRKQILWDIYHKAIKNKQVDLFGTGEETRDFIYIQDITYSIQLILERSIFNADIYNVANGYEVNIRELTQLFLSSLGMKNVDIAFSGEIKPGDPQRWCADIQKIKQLGFVSHFDLEYGLAEYVRWIKGLFRESLE